MKNKLDWKRNSCRFRHGRGGRARRDHRIRNADTSSLTVRLYSGHEVLIVVNPDNRNVLDLHWKHPSGQVLQMGTWMVGKGWCWLTANVSQSMEWSAQYFLSEII